jgi:hypothetical protein
MGNCSTCSDKLSVDISPNSFIKRLSSEDNNGYSQLYNDDKRTYDKTHSFFSQRKRSYEERDSDISIRA